MDETFSFYLEDEQATERLGRVLAKQRPPSAVIYLMGDLGAGKTTFSRGFIQACGHQGVVKSPTYTLIEPYMLSQQTIYHLDLYRLSDPEELEYLGMDLLTQPETISLVEWPERGVPSLPPADLTLTLKRQQTGRQAILTAHTPAASQWLAKAKSHLGLDI
jgi:tRNA threonylcarbamoyladenosine biosynthesis protein TsaE